MKTKICTRCKRELPATKDYFYAKKMGKYDLDSRCKQCVYKYAQENKERESERKRKWYEKNKELCKERAKNHYYSNHQQQLDLRRKYREKNKKTIKEQIKEHYEKNKQDYIMRARKRHHEIKGLPATLTQKQWGKCKDYFDNKCAYCGKEVGKLQKEHFISIQKGGEFTINNIIPSCISCNNSKSDRDFFEWYPKKDFYSKEREEKIFNYLNYDDGVQQLKLS